MEDGVAANVHHDNGHNHMDNAKYDNRHLLCRRQPYDALHELLPGRLRSAGGGRQHDGTCGGPDRPIRAWRRVASAARTIMALPAATQYGILPTEMEYVASSETLVRILPLVSVDRVRLLSGTYGPFRPPAHAEVPLWLALSLRKKRKCVIIPPDWLSVGAYFFLFSWVDALTEYVRQETTSLPFAPLPLHYVAIAKLLLEQCVW